MDVKSESHVTLIIRLTDDEARDIITDPSDFVSALQDLLPNGVSERKPRRISRSGTRKRGWKMKTIHCHLCDRDIASGRYDKHMQAKHPDQGAG